MYKVEAYGTINKTRILAEEIDSKTEVKVEKVDKVEEKTTETIVPELPVTDTKAETVVKNAQGTEPKTEDVLDNKKPKDEEVVVKKDTPKVEDVKKEIVIIEEPKLTISKTATVAGSIFAVSWLVWMCGTIVMLLAGSVIGLLMLSFYYKRQINSMKQAPFSVPSWAPTILFPRDYSFYYEYEITMKERNGEVEMENNNLEKYLK